MKTNIFSFDNQICTLVQLYKKGKIGFNVALLTFNHTLLEIARHFAYQKEHSCLPTSVDSHPQLQSLPRSMTNPEDLSSQAVVKIQHMKNWIYKIPT